ncbi:MAG: pyridoxamine 5'-phosphate oxidase family protein [bacterium]
MVIREMSEDECRAALERASFGRLGCARDNQPYVIPISLSYAAGHLYGFSTLGQKIEWMRANPLVCVELEERTAHDDWTSVVVFGRYDELVNTTERSADRAQAQQALQRHATWWQYTSVPGAEWKRKAGPFTPIFYRVRIDTLTGHRATPAG